MALDYTMMRDAANMAAMNRLSRAQSVGEAMGTLGFLGADKFRNLNTNIGQGGLLNMLRGRQNPFTQESIADQDTMDMVYKTSGDIPDSEGFTEEIPQYGLPEADMSIKPTIAPYSDDYAGSSEEINLINNAVNNPYIDTSNLVELGKRGQALQTIDDTPLYSEDSPLAWLSGLGGSIMDYFKNYEYEPTDETYYSPGIGRNK